MDSSPIWEGICLREQEWLVRRDNIRHFERVFQDANADGDRLIWTGSGKFQIPLKSYWPLVGGTKTYQNSPLPTQLDNCAQTKIQ